jgi:type I restriction enzyme S subunit
MSAVKKSILPENAVCVSCIGNIGYVGKTITQSVSNQQINAIIVNKNHNSDYVYYLMKYLWLLASGDKRHR